VTDSDKGRWNGNIHYHPLVLRAIPEGAQRALDIGCGEGTLPRKLRQVVPHVTGIDLHTPSLDEAREHMDDIDYVVGDFLTYPFEPASFDLIACVATLHHVDAAAGLERMRDLLRPGGRLVIIGLARSSWVYLPLDLAGVIGNYFHSARNGFWHHPSPMVWPPPVTYPQMRALAASILPGSRYRRHVLFRYSITWQRI
jgi:SAM-dependent methyltransferase